MQKVMKMPRGRPAKAPARSLNVRVEVSDLEKLALLQTITGKATAEVVRDAIKLYIKLNDGKLREAGERLAQGKPVRARWPMTQEEREAYDVAAKPENHYDSAEEWDNN
ncbi:hypothetical protein GWC77_27345 [Paraburkholderia sp. NMBU_R16]|uniref:hypothetical protein n=1 Tax=Paraburkholderia sp. NMBU_R16 TaxID=2698676 RepID=UPI0015653013|nr:hypothetical protein [Paraburkholderia sp. NMBU_R16]NRO99578.1 hypothetical protein [Paraburkholderia sp. NMBU_R16]